MQDSHLQVCLGGLFWGFPGPALEILLKKLKKYLTKQVVSQSPQWMRLLVPRA